MEDFYQSSKYMNEVFHAILAPMGVKKVTKYVSKEFVIKVTRVGKIDKRANQISYTVTIGNPNYLERQFIKNYKKAGVKFPVGKVQLKHYK